MAWQHCVLFGVQTCTCVHRCLARKFKGKQPSAGHSAPSSIAEDSASEKHATTQPRKAWTLKQWFPVLATLAIVVSPAALFGTGHVVAHSASGRARLASGVYGAGAASLGRCLQHMVAPEGLATSAAGHAEYGYQPYQGSAAHLSEELACFLTAAARESQRGLSAAASVAYKAFLSLHAHGVAMAARTNGVLSPALQRYGGPAKSAMHSTRSKLGKLCPTCMSWIMSLGEAIQQLSLQHVVRLGSPEVMGGKYSPIDQVASWAPAKPSSIVPQLMSTSHTALLAVRSVVPEHVSAFASRAWARARTWLHVCATWPPSEQPQLTALHSAVFLAHDCANIALHSLKRAAGWACSMAECASTCLCGATGSISAQAAGAWHSLNGLLQFASLGAMTDAEREAHLAPKMTCDDPLDPATAKQAPATGKGIAGWLGSLWGTEVSPIASTAGKLTDFSTASGNAEPAEADRSASLLGAQSISTAAEHDKGEAEAVPVSSSGLSHVKLEGGGVVRWDGQPEHFGQPELPAGDQGREPEEGKAPAESQPEAVRVEDTAVLQHVQSATGGTVTWAGQREQDGLAGEGAPLAPHVLTEQTPMDMAPPREEPSVAMSHTQTKDGGSVTWAEQVAQAQHDQRTLLPNISKAEAAGLGAVQGKVGQAGGSEPEQGTDAGASGSSGSCSESAACRSEVEGPEHAADPQPAAVQQSDAAAQEEQSHTSGEEGVMQAPSESTPGANPAASAAKDTIDDADATHGSISREGDHGRGECSSHTSMDAGSSAEDIAAVLADAVHALEEDQEMQQPDQDSWVHGKEGLSDVAHRLVPAAALSRLSKLGQVMLTSPMGSYIDRP